jgi:hypothetical protein
LLEAASSSDLMVGARRHIHFGPNIFTIRQTSSASVAGFARFGREVRILIACNMFANVWVSNRNTSRMSLARRHLLLER